MFKFFLNNFSMNSYFIFFNDYNSFTNNSNKLKIFLNYNVKLKNNTKYLFQKYTLNSQNSVDTRILVIQNLFDFRYTQIRNFFNTLLFIVFIFFILNFLILIYYNMLTLSFFNISLLSFFFMYIFFIFLFLIVTLISFLLVTLLNVLYIIVFSNLNLLFLIVFSLIIFLFFQRLFIYVLFFMFFIFIFKTVILTSVIFIFLFFIKLLFVIFLWYLLIFKNILTLTNSNMYREIDLVIFAISHYLIKLKFILFFWNNNNLNFILVYLKFLLLLLLKNFFNIIYSVSNLFFIKKTRAVFSNKNLIDYNFYYFFIRDKQIDTMLLLKYNYILMSKLKFSKFKWNAERNNFKISIDDNLLLPVNNLNLFNNNFLAINSNFFNNNFLLFSLLNNKSCDSSLNTINLFSHTINQVSTSSSTQFSNFLFKKNFQREDIINFSVQTYLNNQLNLFNYNEISSLSNKWNQARLIHFLNNKTFLLLINKDILFEKNKSKKINKPIDINLLLNNENFLVFKF